MSQRGEPEGRGTSVSDGVTAWFSLVPISVCPSNKGHLLLQTLVSCLSFPLGCELTRAEELMAFFPLRFLLSSKKSLGYQFPG